MTVKIIKVPLCGDCPYYDWEEHKCSQGATDYPESTERFYRDCPLEEEEE